MVPVRTPRTNFVYRLPGDDTGEGDLPCERQDGRVISTWELTPEERIAIAEGAHLELVVLSTPPPPVALGVSEQPREIPG